MDLADDLSRGVRSVATRRSAAPGAWRSPYSCSTSATRCREDGLLIERSLVGDLLRVDRRRLLEQDARSTRVELPAWAAAKRGERDVNRPITEACPSTCAGASGRRGQAAAGRHDWETRGRDVVAIMACDDDVLHEIGRSAASSAARRGPTRTQVPVDSLKSSAIRPWNVKPARWIGWIDEANRIAQAVEAVLVERGPGELGVAPVARRDVRARERALRAGRRPARLSTRRRARARRCGRRRLGHRPSAERERRGLGRAEAGHPGHALRRTPAMRQASNSWRYRLPQAGGRIEQHLQPAEERPAEFGVARSAGSSSS